MTFAQGMFSIDPKSTPDQVARKRAMIAALMPRYGSAKYVGEGLGQLAQGVMTGIQNRKLDKIEGAGTAGANDIFSRLMGRQGARSGASGPMSVLGIPPETSQPMPAADIGMIGAQGGGSFGLPAADTGGMQGGMSMPPQKSGGLDFGSLEQQYGLPAGYLSDVAQIESGGDPNAQNPNSSAGGMFQFTDGTAKQYGVADRFDPSQAASGAARLAADNAASLRKVLGREPTAGELYLAHQQGAGGASKLLSNPDALASAIVGSEAVRLNGGTDNMTAGEFANKWVSKVGGGQGGEYAPPQIPMDELYGAMQSPWMNDQQRAMIGSLINMQTQAADPMQQMQMQKAQLELQQMQNPGAPKPIEVGGVLLDPTTYQPIFDSRTQAQAGGGEFGLTPQYITNPDGTLGMVQLGKDGSTNVVKLPEGAALQKGVEKLDLGTSYQWYNTLSGAPIGEPIPKDTQTEAENQARGTAIGGAQGAAQVAAPGDYQAGQNALDFLEGIRNDPAIDRGTGLSSAANAIPGSAGYDFAARVEQAKSGAFLTAIQQMRGMGSLSNAEGSAATAAVTRMNTALSKEAFLAALSDYEKIVRQGMAKATKNGAQGTTAQPAQQTEAGIPDDLTPEEKAMLGLQ